jgi:hypothetical protein
MFENINEKLSDKFFFQQAIDSANKVTSRAAEDADQKENMEVDSDWTGPFNRSFNPFE